MTVSRRTLAAAALILALPVVVRAPFWLAGLSEDPIWTVSYLTLPGSSQLLPGFAGYCDPNAGQTTQALGTAAARMWLSGHVPWWDPYSGLGMPMVAEMQSSALFLPYILLLLLPGGYVLLMLSLQWTAGLATWRLLRGLDLGERAAVTGALLFELCASFAWLGPPMSLPVAFLPLFLLGLEQARAACLAGRRGGWRTIAAALSLSIVAGFPETAYLDGLLAFAWAVTRLAMLPGRRAGFAARVALGGTTGLLLAAPALWPFFDFLPHAATGLRDVIDMSKLALPGPSLAQLLAPYALGPVTGLPGQDSSSLSFTIWTRAASYAGATLTLAALLGATVKGRDRALRSMLAVFVAVVLGRVTGAPGLTEVFDFVPFANKIEVFRYAGAAWLLPCCILAAYTVDRPPQARRVCAGVSVVSCAAAAALAVAWTLARTVPGAPQWFVPAAAWAALSLAAFAATAAWGRSSAMCCALIVDAAVLFAVPLAAGIRGGRLDTTAIAFLKSHLGEQRFTAIRAFLPNYGAMFGTASINHNYLPAPELWTSYIDGRLRPGSNPVQFLLERPDDPAVLAGHLAGYAGLAVRYVVTHAGFNPFATPGPSGTATALPLSADGMTAGRLNVPPGSVAAVTVLVGTYAGASTGDLEVALCGPSGACAHGSASLTGAPDNQPLRIPIDPPFRSAGEIRWTLRHPTGQSVVIWQYETPEGPTPDIRAIAADAPPRVYADALIDIYELPGAAPYASAEGCSLQAHGRTSFDADCAAPATLVRRELAMPGWQARVNGAAVPITPLDEVLQSVPLPAGRSAVTFAYRPPGYAWFMALFGLGAAAMVPWRALGIRPRTRFNSGMGAPI